MQHLLFSSGTCPTTMDIGHKSPRGGVVRMMEHANLSSCSDSIFVSVLINTGRVLHAFCRKEGHPDFLQIT